VFTEQRPTHGGKVFLQISSKKERYLAWRARLSLQMLPLRPSKKKVVRRKTEFFGITASLLRRETELHQEEARDLKVNTGLTQILGRGVKGRRGKGGMGLW